MLMDIDALRAQTPGLRGTDSPEQRRRGIAGAADAGCHDRPAAAGGGDRRVRGRRGGTCTPGLLCNLPFLTIERQFTLFPGVAGNLESYLARM